MSIQLDIKSSAETKPDDSTPILSTAILATRPFRTGQDNLIPPFPEPPVPGEPGMLPLSKDSKAVEKVPFVLKK